MAIKAKEVWASREERRTDDLAEEGTFEASAGGVEVKKVFYLTGAETERRALEKLLLRRAEFTGQSLDANAKVDASDQSGWRDSASSGDHPPASGQGLGPKKAVIGFGKEMAEVYGLGSRFDERVDGEQENERFQTNVDEQELPAVVKSRGGNFTLL